MLFSHEKKEILKSVTARMNPEDCELSEVSQTRDRYRVVPLCGESHGHTRRSGQWNGGRRGDRGAGGGEGRLTGCSVGGTDRGARDSPHGMSPWPMPLLSA